jgi:hypothetical protein
MEMQALSDHTGSSNPLGLPKSNLRYRLLANLRLVARGALAHRTQAHWALVPKTGREPRRSRIRNRPAPSMRRRVTVLTEPDGPR